MNRKERMIGCHQDCEQYKIFLEHNEEIKTNRKKARTNYDSMFHSKYFK
jgi:hypothetical protein